MFAVINLGMKSIRLCLLDHRHRITFKRAYPLNSVIFGDGVEQDGNEWWHLTQMLFRDAEASGCELDAIEALTVSASASCLACVDVDGLPLRPIIMVSDRRHHECNGTENEPIMLQRIRWIQRHEPEVFVATHRFLAPNDYIIHRLTGIASTDTLNAEKLGYDVRHGDYEVSEEAIRSRLPKVQSMGEVVGTISASAAFDLRLKPSVEVVLSSYDAIVSVLGSGVSDEGVLCDVSGTVTSIRLQTATSAPHIQGAVVSQAMPELGCHYVGGSNNLGGGLIEWLKSTFYQRSPHVYDMMQSDAQSVSARDSRIIFLPYLLGERAPIWNPDARGVFFGVERMHSRKHFVRATLEAAAYSGRTLIDAVSEAYGKRPTKIRLSGGLSRMEICNRIKADIYGMPLEIVSEFESTVLGAYLMAFHQRLGLDPRKPGWLNSVVKVRDIVFPDDDAAEIYRDGYKMFLELYQALQPVFKKHRKRISMPMKSEDGYLENL